MDDSGRAAALGQLRVLSGLSQREAARRIGIRLSVLRSWENGESSPLEPQLRLAVKVYGRDVERLLPPRPDLISPSDPGVLTVGRQSIDTDRIRSEHPDPSGANRRILRAYLAAIRHERGVGPTENVGLRSVELAQLAIELDLSDAHLSDLLAQELNLSAAGARTATRALLIAGIMSLVTLGGLGNGWFRSSAGQQGPITTDGRRTTTVQAPAVPQPAFLPATTTGFVIIPNQQFARQLFSVQQRPPQLETPATAADPSPIREDLFSPRPQDIPVKPALE